MFLLHFYICENLIVNAPFNLMKGNHVEVTQRKSDLGFFFYNLVVSYRIFSIQSWF